MMSDMQMVELQSFIPDVLNQFLQCIRWQFHRGINGQWEALFVACDFRIFGWRGSRILQSKPQPPK